MKKLVRKHAAFSVMFMAVMMMTVTVSITLTYSAVVLSGSQQAQNNIDSVKAFYAAESIAERFIYFVKKDNFDPTNYNTNGILVDEQAQDQSAGESCIGKFFALPAPESITGNQLTGSYSCNDSAESKYMSVGQINVKMKYVAPEANQVLKVEVTGDSNRAQRVVELGF